MTWAATAAWAAAAIGAASAITSAQSQRKAASYNAKVASNNATIASQQASANEDAQRRRADMALGREAAGAAASGGLSGTNLDNYQQSATNAELDALNIRYQGKLGVQQYTEQATLDNWQSSNANESGYLNAAAAALSSYGSYQNGQAKLKGSGG
jgi:hypothetical protein